MKANELRLGIWAYLFGDAVQLTSDHLAYLFEKGGVPEPITLTNEWLEKFGFILVGNSDMYAGAYKHTNRHHVAVYDGKFTYRIPGSSIKNITNVHQLQNLYFALTGEELTIVNPEQTPIPRQSESK